MLDPEDCEDVVLQEPMNVYSIASPKANRWTGAILREYSKRWAPRLAFRADPLSGDVRNVDLSIFCDDEVLRPAGWTINEKGDRYARDFGLIVRGPNPFNPDRMAVVIAGRSSLGTEAACLAFTDPKAVGIVQKRLLPLGVSLENHNVPFWAVASMQRAIGDGREEALRETLRIERVDVLANRSAHITCYNMMAGARERDLTLGVVTQRLRGRPLFGGANKHASR
jgi:hypothetical protein